LCVGIDNQKPTFKQFIILIFPENANLAGKAVLFTVGNAVQVELLHSVNWKLVRSGHRVGRRNNYENGQSDDQVVGQIAPEEFRYAFHFVEPHFRVSSAEFEDRIRQNNGVFRKSADHENNRLTGSQLV
jgi:hypothetical protein